MTMKCVRSLLKYETNSCIMVVDNGSDCQERNTLISQLNNLGFVVYSKNNYKCHFKLRNQKRILYLLDKNYGYAAGNNYGLKLAAELDYEIFGIVNNDVVLKESVLPQLLECMNTFENVALVGPRVITGTSAKDSNPVQDRSSFYYLFWYKLFYPVLVFLDLAYRKRKRNDSNMKVRLTRKKEFLSGCFFIGKIDLVEKIGFFDENTFLYAEEMILKHKLLNHGYQTVFCPTVSVIHLHGQSTKLFSERHVSKHNYEALRYYLKTYKKYCCIQLLLLDFAQLVWQNFWLPIKIFFRRILKSKWEGWK